MSKLIVEVCKVEELISIEGADRIESAKIKGWNCIVPKNIYKIGDNIIFCPPDSIIPDNLIDKFKLEFLKKNGKVGTIKLKGTISQGLVLDNFINAKFGENVADKLGIIKYEPPEPSYQSSQKRESVKEQFGKLLNKEISLRRFIFKSVGIIKDKYFTRKKKMNSLFDVYTDIDNIKNYNTIFNENDEVIISEKIHGSNFRCGYLSTKSLGIKGWFRRVILKRKYEFCYGSHKVQLLSTNNKTFYEQNIYAEMIGKYNLESICKNYPNYLFYGEVYGKNVQELEYGLNERRLAIFDIKDVKIGKYLNWSELERICYINNLPIVPCLYKGKFNNEILKTCSLGKSTVASHMREGCVVKPLIEENNCRIGRKILKSISEEYLLSKNRTEFH